MLADRMEMAASSALRWYRAGDAPNPIAAYQAKGASSLAASYVNLANPGVNNAAPGVAPTWDAANGWTFGGTHWLTTGIVITTRSPSILVRFDSASAGALVGYQLTTANRVNLIPNQGGTLRRVRFPDEVNVSGALSGGVWGATPSFSYLNGVQDAPLTGTFSGTNTHALYIGARNNIGVADILLTGRIQALVIYSSTLTAGMVAAVSSAISLL